jgi:hypothetical protein
MRCHHLFEMEHYGKEDLSEMIKNLILDMLVLVNS